MSDYPSEGIVGLMPFTTDTTCCENNIECVGASIIANDIMKQDAIDEEDIKSKVMDFTDPQILKEQPDLYTSAIIKQSPTLINEAAEEFLKTKDESQYIDIPGNQPEITEMKDIVVNEIKEDSFQQPFMTDFLNCLSQIKVAEIRKSILDKVLALDKTVSIGEVEIVDKITSESKKVYVLFCDDQWEDLLEQLVLSNKNECYEFSLERLSKVYPIVFGNILLGKIYSLNQSEEKSENSLLHDYYKNNIQGKKTAVKRLTEKQKINGNGGFEREFRSWFEKDVITVHKFERSSQVLSKLKLVANKIYESVDFLNQSVENYKPNNILKNFIFTEEELQDEKTKNLLRSLQNIIIDTNYPIRDFGTERIQVPIYKKSEFLAKITNEIMSWVLFLTFDQIFRAISNTEDNKKNSITESVCRKLDQFSKLSQEKKAGIYLTLSKNNNCSIEQVESNLRKYIGQVTFTELNVSKFKNIISSPNVKNIKTHKVYSNVKIGKKISYKLSSSDKEHIRKLTALRLGQ